MILFFLLLATKVFGDFVDVQTLFGTVRGIHDPISNVDIFRGIPYSNKAKRLEKSTLIHRWSSILNATDYAPKCIQYLKLNIHNTSDDCLFLDIYKPSNIHKNSNVPVVVYIHGGAFVSGSVNEKSSNFFAQQYAKKVGCDNSASFPCNIGLWDQVTAFKFINQTIHSFGGNPKKMTLWGHSAGSISASIHSKSPISSGYFKNFIEMSGSSYGLDFAKRFNDHKRNSINILNELGCTNSSEYVSCFNKVDPSVIIKNTPNVMLPDVGDSLLPFNHSFTYSQNVFIGLTSLESLYFVLKVNSSSKLDQLTVQESIDIIQSGLKLTNLPIDKLIYRLMQQYGISPAEAAIRILSVIQFDGPVLMEIDERVLKSNSNVFVYHHKYFNPKIFKDDFSFKQSFHTTILPYTIDEFYSHNFTFTQKDTEIQKFYVESLINFIKTGNPSIVGIQFSPTTIKRQYLEVGNNFTFKNEFFEEQHKLAKVIHQTLAQ
ncbi:unnamed protein product [Caenorhabditis angaria]|uniref:Carboxylic ester hydrolase n=1 Tax=Caenorhabditis angaria TaxID=860376 RepID=A0A9P1MWM8_9PELO|nr:unnamed protein product [Caenorhabditis angaria]